MQGFPISWGSIATTVRRHYLDNKTPVWSPCSRFIAVAQDGATAQDGTIEVLDAVTLARLGGFKCPEGTLWLSFSPDSRSLTHFSHCDYGLTTWDLQTGGRISAIPLTPNKSSWYFSSTYSMDGKTVAVAYRDFENTAVTIISAYNLLSGTHAYSHRVSEGRVVAPIWTHGEFIRFVTLKPGSITIWEVGFTSMQTLAEVESLPAPDDISPDDISPGDISPDDIIPNYVAPNEDVQTHFADKINSKNPLFLPARPRLAFIIREAVIVWDARESKILLSFVGDEQPGGISFSSDGRFFACGSAIGQGIHLWKESPTGYVLHRKLVSSIFREAAPIFIQREDTIPLLSPNGESIITSKYSETQLWRTTDPITSLPSAPTRLDEQTDFLLRFSPDNLLVATARLGDNVVTIIDLKSGNPRLVVDTGMKICGLGVTRNTVIVVGYGKIVTWELPTGDHALGASANIHDSIRTVVFNHSAPPPTKLHSASISPDFNYIVITREASEGLDIYDISTGKHLAGTTVSGHIPWFTRGGREVWSSRTLLMEGRKITKDGQSGVIGVDPLRSNAGPSGGPFPWISPHGHYVTNDGWVFNSRDKRLMWLPHRWRSYQRLWIWDGRFAGLLDPGLPEPVILELDE